jgi:hypothetical protein
MRRREFITLLGGATTFSFAASAQHVPVRSIGFLHAGSPEPNANFVSAFRKGLSETDHVEGHDFSIEFRWAAGRDDRLPELAADLIDRKVAVIAAPGSTQAALAAKVATSTIPIVFSVAADPVALGLVSSFNHPSGNATGIFFIWLAGGQYDAIVPRADLRRKKPTANTALRRGNRFHTRARASLLLRRRGGGLAFAKVGGGRQTRRTHRVAAIPSASEPVSCFRRLSDYAARSGSPDNDVPGYPSFRRGEPMQPGQSLTTGREAPPS